MTGRIWRGGRSQPGFEFDRISDYLAEDDTLVWVDMYDPDQRALEDLAQELGLNIWAVEDAVAPVGTRESDGLPNPYVLHGIRAEHGDANCRRRASHPADQTPDLGVRDGYAHW